MASELEDPSITFMLKLFQNFKSDHRCISKAALQTAIREAHSKVPTAMSSTNLATLIAELATGADGASPQELLGVVAEVQQTFLKGIDPESLAGNFASLLEQCDTGQEPPSENTNKSMHEVSARLSRVRINRSMHLSSPQ